MPNKLVAFVARHAGKERSTTTKVFSLLSGAVAFFVLVPPVLGLFAHWMVTCLALPQSPNVLLGAVSVILGLAFLLWSISAFWFAGKGTPVPFASPTLLVTTGPFRYTRNPIKLGAVLFYLGIGSIFDGVATGLVMLFLGVILGSIYHKLVEEKELLIRFGQDYENYRRRTSFLIPLPPRRG
jgi:protein-S-isoprenylcysteine O-methyltransferase Ste14